MTESICVLLVGEPSGGDRPLRDLLLEGGAGFTVENVESLEGALGRLDAGGIDMVVSDLGLPDAQGMEVFKRLKAHPSEVPVILLSGVDDEALGLRLLEEGAQDCLVKPAVTAALLARSVRYAVRRAEAGRKLGAERDLLRSVVDSIPDSIYVKDAQGRYILDNAAHRSQLGVASAAEVIGRTVFDFFPKEVAQRFNADDGLVMGSGEPILNRQESAGGGDSAPRWLSTTKVALRGPRGEVIGLIGLGRDITAHKAAEAKAAEFAQALRERNAELQEDLEMAREVQQAFMPQQFPNFPLHASEAESALGFHVSYLPTTTLGGDFFQVLPISDTRAGVFICDVMGHGVRAALITAIERALVEELSGLANEPGQFLAKMNHSLVSLLRRTRIPMFVSAFYMVVDWAEGTIRYANAGHPRPLLLRRKAGVLEVLGARAGECGPALGVFETPDYLTVESGVEPEDFVMLYTDGLYEVEGADGAYFDQRLLREVVGGKLALATGKLFAEVLAAVQKFAANGAFIDDVCLVGVEVRRTGQTPIQAKAPR